MRVRLSEGFAKHWQDQHLDGALPGLELAPRLRALLDAPLVSKGGALLLQPLDGDARLEDFPDLTGFEAFVNKVHVDDFVDLAEANDAEHLGQLIRQGVKAGFALAEKLAGYGKYRVLLSLDSDLPTIALRFFELRDGELWGNEDPDAFPLEDVMMIDTCPFGS